jgi:catechol 2,3-dioxygenase-like lactoylglutathione lyase family enzyme
VSEQDKLFAAAFPYCDDILALPVNDLSQTAAWYSESFGLQEVERRETPNPTVILERDGVQIGFAINGLDPANEGAAILVNDIHRAKEELESPRSRNSQLACR